MNNLNKFTWADAWLLLSILYSKKEDSSFEIKEVIMAADMINHAILEHSEIDEGIDRLLLAGYLKKIDEKFVLTERSLGLLEVLSKKKTSASKKIEQIEKVLDAVPFNKDYKINPVCLGKHISKHEYQKAINQYLGKA